jgi:hypothetical protein
VIFELEFLRYGKHDNRPVKIARMMEIAPDVEAVKARVRRLSGTSAWPEGTEAVRILDHEGHEAETSQKATKATYLRCFPAKTGQKGPKTPIFTRSAPCFEARQGSCLLSCLLTRGRGRSPRDHSKLSCQTVSGH